MYEYVLDTLLCSSFILFCISASWYIHAKFQVAGFKTNEVHVHVIVLLISHVYFYSDIYRPFTVWFPALRYIIILIQGTCRLYKPQWQLMFLSVWSEWVVLYLGQNKSIFFIYIYGVIQCEPKTRSGWMYKQRYRFQSHK